MSVVHSLTYVYTPPACACRGRESRSPTSAAAARHSKEGLQCAIVVDSGATSSCIYAVGAYVLPGEESSKKMADLFGSRISESSIGALHTHSAVTKVDLDIAGTANSFKKK